MYCSKCGAELKEDSKFCSSCGFSLQKAIIREEKKGIVGQFIEAVKLSFIWSGRFSRRQFILILFGGILMEFLIGILLWFLGWDEDLIFKFVDLIVLIFFVVFVGAAIRRFHDIDKSGWYVLLLFIPLVGFVVFVLDLILEQGKEIGKTRWG